ncbi:hypothetical protein LXA43DRAFT_905160, partial [Ganoderma leucocontextum]
PFVLMYFVAFIPTHLERRTQVILRSLMHRPVSSSDGPGYIYALELADPTRPDIIRIKVGRSINVRLRLSQHIRRCPSSAPKLLGFFPSQSSTHRGAGAPYCDRVERLVHVELADLSANSYPRGRSAPYDPCTDCRSRHKEIFTFRRLQGSTRGQEWPLIIRPVVQRWARFVQILS